MAKNSHHKDFTNCRVGNLLVISRLEDKPNSIHDKIQWLAHCDCGKQITVSSRQLHRTPNRSCGCQRRIHAPLFARDPKNTNINNYFSSYKGSASKRSINWHLTKEQFCKLIFDKCFYCGIEPNKEQNVFNKTRYKKAQSMAALQRHIDGKIVVNGIDRKNNHDGYHLDNCVTCCKDCNYGKLTKTPKEFLDWIERVYEHSRARTATRP